MQQSKGKIICHIVTNGEHLYVFSTSKLQDEIKTEKIELNKFHASKKDPFY
jgi:hypothetical protein